MRIAIIVVGLIAAAGGYLGSHSDDTQKLAVGDCLTNKGTAKDPNIEQLDCSDPKADYKVLKKDGSTSLAMLACQSVQGTTAAISWREGSDSFVLCLGDNRALVDFTQEHCGGVDIALLNAGVATGCGLG
ncbi:LppU/SCO3897 family protein, partial [Streptomyces sp. NPDC002550]